MDTQNTLKTVAQQAKEAGDKATDKAADTAHAGLQSAQHTANKTVDRFTENFGDKGSDKVDEAKGGVAPWLDRAENESGKLLQQGREMVNDASQKVRESAAQASDKAVGYTKDEPVKALLIAAGVGALLMGMLTMMARSRD